MGASIARSGQTNFENSAGGKLASIALSPTLLYARHGPKPSAYLVLLSRLPSLWHTRGRVCLTRWFIVVHSTCIKADLPDFAVPRTIHPFYGTSTVVCERCLQCLPGLRATYGEDSCRSPSGAGALERAFAGRTHLPIRPVLSLRPRRTGPRMLQARTQPARRSSTPSVSSSSSSWS